MKFSKVKAARIPKGSVARIRSNDNVLWERYPILARYVSLGDSIAAGHAINDEWERDYGVKSQYGINGNTETTIVPGCYTDLIHLELSAINGGGRIQTTSFAKSGDRVDDLIEKLDHDVVKKALAKADYVTLCIGANDVLEPALSHLDQYIEAGDSALAEIAAIVETNLAVLADDSNANSYTALFNKLASINPNAKYVFTTIYNPYKYLWIEDGSNGFFKPVLNVIPQMTILGFEVDEAIKNGLLNTPAVRTLFSRVNGLCVWAEKYVTALNNVLRNKINAYGNPNIVLAETKTLFEQYPDRPVAADIHYNDLVNVEYTRGYDTMQMDWGKLYEDSGGAGTFWFSLAAKYLSWSGLDINGMANELIPQIVEKVIVPDVDPHPERQGHIVLKEAFASVLY